MLTILDEKVRRTPEDIENQYENCKFILLDYGDIQYPNGFLYCVSESEDSYLDICEIADKFANGGTPCMLSGSYNNWIPPCVQHEFSEKLCYN